MEQEKNDVSTSFISGRNAVHEALRSGRPADTLFVAEGGAEGSLRALIAKAKAQGIVVKDVKKQKLEQLCGNSHHQGVVLAAAAHTYADLEDLFVAAQAKGEPPFFVICDEIEDPHNLGAVVRTAEGAGAHGVIVPRRRSAPLSETVDKTAAGALEYLPVARVANLAAAIEQLKARGVWIYGADMAGTPFEQWNPAGPVALVIGAEGKGLGRLIKERCDGLVSLPMRGHVRSLNASVAAGILLYEIARHRCVVQTHTKG
ncbi:MAG: 23S rRNA (guanosine(2251)-2'-O)-methyltransferase RlmB [Oscillospiraceae bacterium]|jgi:23S rRNA (guanosine2251-2'-O)-methyltransferase|nr:23S rRNA (guanosine(2251)-2'-O)-methyltransferase RlmB [Oscillospiraceae bacterium]